MNTIIESRRTCHNDLGEDESELVVCIETTTSVNVVNAKLKDLRRHHTSTEAMSPMIVIMRSLVHQNKGFTSWDQLPKFIKKTGTFETKGK